MEFRNRYAETLEKNRKRGKAYYDEFKKRKTDQDRARFRAYYQKYRLTLTEEQIENRRIKQLIYYNKHKNDEEFKRKNRERVRQYKLKKKQIVEEDNNLPMENGKIIFFRKKEEKL
jgi:uncharacterized protein YijF (DUF1287 family)